ncbi:MAG TPA: DUF559 domain-containing protein, partial [Methylomirabilota bacterium]|nr:DUF559 domain-containing protein [Methylomirabilota bacterium]
GPVVRGPMLETTAPLYPPSLQGGEGRVREEVARGETRTGVVCESPRDYARGLRRRQTDAERRLRGRLRDRRLLGAKFARQVPIGPYVVDFCCREQTRSDTERTALLEALGYRVLRFWNNEALGNTDGVLERIAQVLAARPSPRPSPRRGEGGGRG